MDNALTLLIPGAMDAPLDSVRFRASLAFSLLVAGVAAFPVNRRLIARGRGTRGCMRTTATGTTIRPNGNRSSRP